MNFTSGISTVALSAFIFVGLSSGAQEPAAPVAPAADSSTVSTAQPDAPAAESPTVSAAQPVAPASGYSKVRIVRLSEVKGEVQLDRNTGKGFETPMANLPITEGDKLKTGNGVAEVEFEDNSTLRLAPNSMVEFPRLELLPSGAKASGVQVLQGMVYVNLMNTKGNEFTVNFGKDKLNLPPDSHVRVQLTSDQALVAVMHGEAQAESPTGSTEVGKNKTLTLSLVGQGEPEIAKNVTEEPFDTWDHNAVQYHKSFANASSFGNAPYAYGINDMNYYGSFVNAAGCGGSMWRPYFSSASWDPFGSGAWAYYPSVGYSWVSPYPWGWTPYHYGSWAFCSGIGWGWRPGGTWMGLANNSFVSVPGRPRPPAHAPVMVRSGLVPVNLKAIPVSSLGPKDTFVFRNNSAGFGVPRGSLGKLNGYSGQSIRNGAATTNVYFGEQRGVSEGGARSASSMRAGPAMGSSAAGRSNSGSMQSPSSSSMQSPSAGMSHASAPAGGGGSRH